MQVRAGVAGVVRDLGSPPLEEGQWVLAGMRLATVVQPGRLKAELRIPETQARDVAIGQPAVIDLRTDTVQGRVSRVDPASQNGMVTVDVTLEGRLPRGARPDLSVDGTIEIERLERVLYVGRPANAQPNGVMGIFKVDRDGKTARRVRVRLGRASVNQIEIVEGLGPGDVIVLSDMSQWDAVDRVRIR
jgi:multidrug efflux pump subunit AcrA (membrane-fusion protein)